MGKIILHVWVPATTNIRTNKANLVNPVSHGVSDSVAPMGGASEAPPKKSRKG